MEQGEQMRMERVNKPNNEEKEYLSGNGFQKRMTIFQSYLGHWIVFHFLVFLNIFQSSKSFLHPFRCPFHSDSYQSNQGDKPIDNR